MFISIFTSVINAIILGVNYIISSRLISVLKNQNQASIFNSRHKQQLTFLILPPCCGDYYSFPMWNSRIFLLNWNAFAEWKIMKILSDSNREGMSKACDEGSDYPDSVCCFS